MNFALIRFLPTSANVPFIRWRFIALGFSALLLIFSMIEFATVGINFGIDFRGGIQTEVEAPRDIEIERIRTVIGDLGLGEPRIQEASNGLADRTTVLIALPIQPGEGAEADNANQAARVAVETAMTENFDGVDIRGTTVISGSVSKELVMTGFLAIGVALFLMLIYIWFRFEWQYSMGAVLALIHDVIATIGMFSVTQMTFDLATVAAILTIVGYSMNDTVVVYDRIRENLRKYKKMPLRDVLNLSINDTLSRTVLTSATTLVALISLYVIGGGSLEGFAFAMIWGVVIGTYSSIFVASPLLLFTDVQRDGGDNS